MVVNPHGFHRVLFSDESTFTNHDEVEMHNMHYWSVDNPHWIRQVEPAMVCQCLRNYWVLEHLMEKYENRMNF